MFLYYQWRGLKKDPNEKLLRNYNEWMKRQEMAKEIESRSDAEKKRFYKEMQGMIQQDFKQMVEEEENHFWSNPPGNYRNHE